MLATGIVAGVLFYFTNMNMAGWVMKCNNLSFFAMSLILNFLVLIAPKCSLAGF